MLSRRNIRIKVMQTFYANEKGSFGSIDLAEKSLLKSIQSAYAILVYNLQVIRLVGEYAVIEAEMRAAKRLPTDEDLKFTPKLAENSIVKTLGNSNTFNELVKTYRISFIDKNDEIKQLFRKLIETKEYKKYIAKAVVTWEDDRDIVIFLYNKIMLGNETFEQELEEQYLNWIDDEASINFKVLQLLSEKELVKELVNVKQFFIDKEDEVFAHDLLQKTHAYYDDFDKLIEPKLENWDLERIASMDIILMKMALCELLYFPNIPIKVSINEYIDISKIYSTPKSKDFINGVLDKLMNQLRAEDKIQKLGRGLQG